MDQHILNDEWILWFHNPLDNDWSIESYIEIGEIKSIEDFWELVSYLNHNHVNNSMLFLMRKGIKPIWEDDNNKDGGCWSFKISKKDIYKAWCELCISILGETLTINSKDNSDITGISISPKKAFSILKIWNRDLKSNNVNILSKKIPHVFLNSSIYKAHNEKK